jgi:hypothetical protein
MTFHKSSNNFTGKILLTANAALRCEQRLAILERSENAKRCESLLNALLTGFSTGNHSLVSLGSLPFLSHFQEALYSKLC